VEWQFRVAAGEPLPLTQEQVRLDGHAVEARLYAEDPAHGFLPSTGQLIALEFPRGEGLRVDTGVEAGDDVTPFYDPMIAKLIAHGATREAALDRLAAALDATRVIGPRSNAAFLAALARAPGFRAGDFDTGFIEAHLDALGATPQPLDRAAVARGALALLEFERARLAAARDPDAPASPWDVADGFQLSGARRLALPLVADGENVEAEVLYGGASPAVTVGGITSAPEAAVVADGSAVYVLHRGRQTKVALRDLARDEAGDHGRSGLVRAPMHGKVLAVLVEPGAAVVRGQRLAIIEAMKMEHTLTAPVEGTVVEIAAVRDAQVAEGAAVIVIEPAKSDQTPFVPAQAGTQGAR
jgi:3-methylcrotonyl-CoA carboxylase alpha subunit